MCWFGRRWNVEHRKLRESDAELMCFGITNVLSAFAASSHENFKANINDRSSQTLEYVQISTLIIILFTEVV
jgi:hypothetical protein